MQTCSRCKPAACPVPVRRPEPAQAAARNASCKERPRADVQNGRVRPQHCIWPGSEPVAARCWTSAGSDVLAGSRADAAAAAAGPGWSRRAGSGIGPSPGHMRDARCKMHDLLPRDVRWLGTRYQGTFTDWNLDQATFTDWHLDRGTFTGWMRVQRAGLDARGSCSARRSEVMFALMSMYVPLLFVAAVTLPLLWMDQYTSVRMQFSLVTFCDYRGRSDQAASRCPSAAAAVAGHCLAHYAVCTVGYHDRSLVRTVSQTKKGAGQQSRPAPPPIPASPQSSRTGGGCMSPAAKPQQSRKQEHAAHSRR